MERSEPVSQTLEYESARPTEPGPTTEVAGWLVLMCLFSGLLSVLFFAAAAQFWLFERPRERTPQLVFSLLGTVATLICILGMRIARHRNIT